MVTEANLTHLLLDQINRGQAADALRQINDLLIAQPEHPGLLTLKAEALRFTGQTIEAIGIYQRAANAGGGTRNRLVAGLLLAGLQRIDESLACLNQAHAEEPDNDEILNSLVTTLFNANRYREGVQHARRLLSVSRNEQYLSNAALLLQSNQQYDEATAVFKKILGERGDSPALLGAALVPARFTCDWEWIESLQRRISACYARGQYAATQEYPLTHLTWCPNERYNLEVTRAYAERLLPAVPLLVTAPRPARPGSRIRVGYLSGDFCNHATMHLMAGLFEHHDRQCFEVFAYDYSRPDISDYRQRFLRAIEHHVDVSTLTNADAAARIAADELDILFDLKGHTGWGRLPILAYRPAALQVAYLGFPGSTGTGFIDYLVGDSVVTPDSSAAFYTETFCRLPNSYQCNDRKRAVAGDPGSRAEHGLPEGAVVFSAFNQSYKIDRASFGVWMRVLKEVPDSVLWLLGQGDAAESNLKRYAQAAGIAPERLIFSAFAPPDRHIARLRLADASLDTLICNGHTTTSDTLWAGVPVITAQGSHFCSRVSESLLRAMNLPELVAKDADAMVQIATRVGRDASYRKTLRGKVAAAIDTAPLFDTERSTRNLETAIVMMVEASRSGRSPIAIDVPDWRRGKPGQKVSANVVKVRPIAADATPQPSASAVQATNARIEPQHREESVKINLGCGSDYMQGWLNVDQWPEVKPDLLMNLEELPWKLEDNCADEILLKHVLEHLGQRSDTFLGIIQELYRISKPGATIRIHVPHPRHNDFLSDPTHVRPILPELFSCFDLAAVEVWQENHLPGTPLAKYLKVDFEVANVQHYVTQYWLKELQEGRVDAAGLMRAIENYNNVVEWTDITLRARKPFRPGHALRKVDAICLERHGGMGDVLMALAAAKAIKAYSDRPIALVTVPALRGLAEACPHIDMVSDDAGAVRQRYGNVRHANLNPVSYGISRMHQVDAYLHSFGVSAEAGFKSIDLTVDAAAEAEAGKLIAAWPAVARDRARVLLHVGQGDANRAWPMERWTELATTLIGLGHQVVAIGSGADSQAAGGVPAVKGLLSAVNALSLLGTIALMRRSTVLVSTDGGPIQLAGASDIGIVGLYSVVAGSCRLPFRHGEAGWHAEEVKPGCSFYPCYQHMHDAEIMAPYSARLQNGTLTAAGLFSSWCPDNGSFACMKHQISVAMVLDAIGRLDASLLKKGRASGRVAAPAAAPGTAKKKSNATSSAKPAAKKPTAQKKRPRKKT